jgi:curved DNA binding protein
MGRGYSANRSATARPSNKDKRPRSVSLTRLKDRLGVIAAEAKSNEEMAKAIQAMDSEDDVASEDENESIRRPDVLTKYKICGTVTDEAIKTVAAACVVGANTLDLCTLGDNFVAGKLGKMFQKSKSEDGKKIKKGLAFPTTVCVNNVLCNHAPSSIRDAVTLVNGDVVKVAVSVHVDGYPTTSALTVVVGAVSGHVEAPSAPLANLLAATHFAINGMVRLVKPGMENQDVTDYIAHVAKCFGVETVEGVLSNRTKRWILDGSECIIARRVIDQDPQQNVADCVIGENEVWTLDVAFTNSTSYRMKAVDCDTNVYRRNEISVIPRLPAAADVVTEVREHYMCFPFSPSRLENPLRSRLGLVELKKHDMLDTFPVLGSAKSTVTVRHSCTVAVTDKRVNVIAGAPAAELPEVVKAACTGQPSSDILDLMTETLTTAEKKVKGSATTAATATPAAPAAPTVAAGAPEAAVADEEAGGGDDDDNAAELPTRNRKAHRSGR